MSAPVHRQYSVQKLISKHACPLAKHNQRDARKKIGKDVAHQSQTNVHRLQKDEDQDPSVAAQSSGPKKERRPHEGGSGPAPRMQKEHYTIDKAMLSDV